MSKQKFKGKETKSLDQKKGASLGELRKQLVWPKHAEMGEQTMPESVRPDYTGTSRPWQGSQIQQNQKTVLF